MPRLSLREFDWLKVHVSSTNFAHTPTLGRTFQTFKPAFMSERLHYFFFSCAQRSLYIRFHFLRAVVNSATPSLIFALETETRICSLIVKQFAA